MKPSLRKNEPFRRYMIFLPHSLCLIYTTYMLGGAWKVTFQRRRRKIASTRTSKGSETAAPWRFKFQNPCRSQWTTGTLKFINDDDLHCSIFWLARFRKPWSIRLWRPQGTSIRFKIFTRTGARVKGYISCKGYHEKDLFCSLPSGSLERPHFLRRYSASWLCCVGWLSLFFQTNMDNWGSGMLERHQTNAMRIVTLHRKIGKAESIGAYSYTGQNRPSPLSQTSNLTQLMHTTYETWTLTTTYFTNMIS